MIKEWKPLDEAILLRTQLSADKKEQSSTPHNTELENLANPVSAEKKNSHNQGTFIDQKPLPERAKPASRNSKLAPECQIHPDDRDLVMPKDLSWWNGLSLDECSTTEVEDNATRFAFFIQYRETEGLDVDAAGKKVRLNNPTYYWNLKARDEDQKKFNLNATETMIPYPLKDRVNKALMKGVINKQAIQTATSFNGLIRQLIRAKKI